MSENKSKALQDKWQARDGVITTTIDSSVPTLIMGMTFSNQQVAQHIVDVHNSSLKKHKDIKAENKKLKQQIERMWVVFGDFCKAINDERNRL